MRYVLGAHLTAAAGLFFALGLHNKPDANPAASTSPLAMTGEWMSETPPPMSVINADLGREWAALHALNEALDMKPDPKHEQQRNDLVRQAGEAASAAEQALNNNLRLRHTELWPLSDEKAKSFDRKYVKRSFPLTKFTP